MKYRLYVLLFCAAGRLFAGCAKEVAGEIAGELMGEMISAAIEPSDATIVTGNIQAAFLGEEQGFVRGADIHFVYGGIYECQFSFDIGIAHRTIPHPDTTSGWYSLAVGPSIAYENELFWLRFGVAAVLGAKPVATFDIAWTSEAFADESLLIGLRLEHGKTVGSSIGLIAGGKF